MSVEEIKALNDLGFGERKIAQLFNLPLRRVREILKERKTKKDRKLTIMSPTLNEHLLGKEELYVDFFRPAKYSLRKAHHRGRTLIHITIAVLSDREKVIDYEVFMSSTENNDILFKFILKNLHHIKGKIVRFDRANNLVKKLGDQFGFIPIVVSKRYAQKMGRSPFNVHVERQIGYVQKRIEFNAQLIEKLEFKKAVEFIKGLIEAEWFNNPKPLLSLIAKCVEIKIQIERKGEEKMSVTLLLISIILSNFEL